MTESQQLSEVMNKIVGMGILETLDVDRLTILLDLEKAKEVFDFSYEDLLRLDDLNFMHDIVGISSNIDRNAMNESFGGHHVPNAQDFAGFVPRVCGVANARREKIKQSIVAEPLVSEKARAIEDFILNSKDNNTR